MYIRFRKNYATFCFMYEMGMPFQLINTVFWGQSKHEKCTLDSGRTMQHFVSLWNGNAISINTVFWGQPKHEKCTLDSGRTMRHFGSCVKWECHFNSYLYNIDWHWVWYKKILHKLEKYCTSRRRVQYFSIECNIFL